MSGKDSVSPLETRAFFDRKLAARRQRISELLDMATRDAEAIIDMIDRDYGPTRIWQWGSLLSPGRFSEISDIDIAVEGFQGGAAEWFELLGKAEAMSELPLDIVQLEKIEPLHAASIKERGRMARERP
jgi:predicted nucleotidyltransferase